MKMLKYYLLLGFLFMYISLLAQNQQITESGYAQIVEISSSKPYVVLHRTASIGTLIVIKNPETQKSLVAEVVGQIPDDIGEDVIIQITPEIANRLNEEESNEDFSVELAYSPHTKTKYRNSIDSLTAIANVFEEGLAEIFKDTKTSNQLTALHKSAPIGTLILVEKIVYVPASNNQDPFDQLNNNSTSIPQIVVKVIGKLPDNQVNKKIAIQLSEKAFKTLNPTNNQVFPVKLQYFEKE